MKKIKVTLAIAVALGLIPAFVMMSSEPERRASAGPVPPPGLTQVAHDNSLQGSGTNASLLSVGPVVKVQRINIGPANNLGRIGWQASQPSILNDWLPSGLGTGEPITVFASDNQGTMMTGVCTTHTVMNCSSLVSDFNVNDILEICNTSAPQDDGVVMLSNEDQRSQAANRFLLSDTGVPGQGNTKGRPIPSMACAHLRLVEWDSAGHPGDLKWLLTSIDSSRQASIVAGFRGIFPDGIANNVHGVYNDFRPVSAETALNGPQGYSTTIAVASNGQATAGGSTTYTINVVSTTGFVAPGGWAASSAHPIPIVVHATTGSYTGYLCTGLTSSTFTGCVGGAATFATGDSVQSGLGGAGWTLLWDEAEGWTFQGTDTSTVELTGLFWSGVASPYGLGPIKTIYNAGPGKLQLDYLSSSSSSANRINTSTGANVTYPPGSTIRLWHSAVYNGEWVLLTPPPYTGSETITVGTVSQQIAANTVTACTDASALSTGNNNNYSPTCNEAGQTFANAMEIRFTGASGSVLTGMSAGNQGDIKKLCNFGVATQIVDGSASSSSANRIHLAGQETASIPLYGCATFRYDNNLYWQLQSMTTTFQVAGQFTGDGTVTSPLGLNIAGASCSAGQFVNAISSTGSGMCGTPSITTTGTLVGHQVFTSSGTYTPTSGTKKVYIQMCGAGGGGGGAQGTTGDAAAGGGGGAGDLWMKYIDCAGSCTGGALTIGAGGAGGSTSGGNGSSGGDTSIVIDGGTNTAPGGTGGTGMTSQTLINWVQGGNKSPGGTSGADVDSRGAHGGRGVAFCFSGCGAGFAGDGWAGNGGESPWGAGGQGQSTNGAAEDNGYGNCSGGSGGATRYATGFAGGTGAAGLVVVWEYN